MALNSLAVAEDSLGASFMLTPQEQDALQQALGLKKPGILSEESDAIKRVNLFLSAIMFFNSDKWTLWINEQIVGPKNAFPGVMVKEVNPHEIVFSIEDSPNHLISLKPNQSYITHEGRVVEGDARIQEVKDKG